MHSGRFHSPITTVQAISGLYGPPLGARPWKHQHRQVKNVPGVKGLEILSMHTCWFGLPGGRSDVRRNVPVGDLLFALVPGGLCSGFLGQCIQARISRNRRLNFSQVSKRRRILSLRLFSCSVRGSPLPSGVSPSSTDRSFFSPVEADADFTSVIWATSYVLETLHHVPTATAGHKPRSIIHLID